MSDYQTSHDLRGYYVFYDGS